MCIRDRAGIDHKHHVISPEAIRPIQEMKIKYLGSKNPRLHTDETLIALSVSAASNPEAGLALEQLPRLKGCQAHTSVMPVSYTHLVINTPFICVFSFSYLLAAQISLCYWLS